MKNLNLKSIAILASFATVFSACEKDDNDVRNPNPTNDEELITTVSLSINSNAFPTLPVQYEYRDIDGIGGNPPEVDTIKLSRNSMYMIKAYLLDESKTPTVDMTEEVEEESDEHLAIWTTDTNYLKVTITDFDTKNPPLPLGLNTLLEVKGPIVTTMRFTLKHQPGIKNGDPNLGETDVEVVFPVVIE